MDILVTFEYTTNQDGPTIVLKKGEAKDINQDDVLKYLPPPKQLPGFQAVAILELFTEEDLGPDLLPSETYGSDHVAIAADLQLFW